MEGKHNIPKRALALFLLLAMALYAVISALHGVLLGNVIDTWHLTSLAQGFPASAQFAGSFAAVITTFICSEKLRKWKMLTFALLLCALMLTALKFASTFYLYVAIWVILGIGAGLLDTILSACMGQLYQGKAAVLTMCLLHTSYGLASTGAPIVFRSLLENGMAWNSVYLIPAAAAAVLFMIGASVPVFTL